MSAAFHIPLRAVFYPRNGGWIAHCLEFDLLGDGATREEALERLTEAIQVQVDFSIEKNDRRILFTPAPGEFFEMFAGGRVVAVGNLQVCIQRLAEFADDVQVREYTEEATLDRKLMPA